MTEGNYSNVGHRGPVYKGLGAINPCDNLHLHPDVFCLMVRIFLLMLLLLYIYIYIYIYSTNIPPIVIINRIYEH
jgi:hypothetical protein